MEVDSNSVTLSRAKLGQVPGGYSMISYTEETQKRIQSDYASRNLDTRAAALNIGETIYETPRDYKGSHYDHFYNFFESIRNGKTVVQDPSFGLRAAGAALLANESYYRNKPVNWDPNTMKLL